ncbi:MAG: hypothetical protein KC502_10780 [Myxococcales bacterium]|nr:hypothetical protein [Myxococcales bacterium]
MGRCGAYVKEAKCQCDSACEKEGDCCKDIKTICVAGVCGNGKCEADKKEDETTCKIDCLVCGDFICSKGEEKTCAKDCDNGGQFNDIKCWDEKCVKETKACKDDADCNKFVKCINSGAEKCEEKLGFSKEVSEKVGKLFDALQKCGYAACTDPTGDSCKDRCGKYDKAKACQCDDGCGDFKDCCSDYEKLCGGSACKPECTGKACGDDGCGGKCGTCDATSTCSATNQCVPTGGSADAGSSADTGTSTTTDAGTATDAGTGGTGGGTTAAPKSSSGCTAAPTSNGALPFALVLSLLAGALLLRRRDA